MCNSYACTHMYVYVPYEFLKLEESVTQFGIAGTFIGLEFGSYVNPHSECSVLPPGVS